jgi:hypothetical protein
LCLFLLAAGSAFASNFDAATRSTLRRTIARVENMPGNDGLQQRARRLGLELLDVTWEDTGRDYGSSVGPNISDVTLQMREPLDDTGTRFRSHLLPVLRAPNFSDKTADIAAEKLWVRVGNQSNGADLVTVPLTEVLSHLREYVSDPDSVLGSGDFLAPRDTHMLVSAQHVFVPIAEQGNIEFTPVIYNYQSERRRPAVLTFLVTRQGTSVVAIENSGKDSIEDSYGQQLYFNNKGQKTTLTAERRSTVAARIEAGQATEQDAGALEEGADMMWIVQVPLKVRARPSTWGGGPGMAAPMDDAPIAPMKSIASEGFSGDALGGGTAPQAVRSDVERAVIGHGDDLGDVTEGNHIKMERDPRFPVRVTVQFYKATSNGVVTAADLTAAKAEIDKVYKQADYVGSLVVAEGERSRPTDWHLGKTQPALVQSRTWTLPAPLTLDDDENASGTVELSLWQRLRAAL